MHTRLAPADILKQAVALQADCQAILIPDGLPVSLSEGQVVYVMQILGGHFTVQTEGRLYRIWDKDAPLLGVSLEAAESDVSLSVPEGDPQALEEAVWNILKTCYDPEIPVNIVELGLIYDCDIAPSVLDPTYAPRSSNGYRVVVQMTLTAPGCGMGPVLMEEIKEKIGRLSVVDSVDVQLMFDPPWNQGMMSEAAKLQLGLI